MCVWCSNIQLDGIGLMTGEIPGDIVPAVGSVIQYARAVVPAVCRMLPPSTCHIVMVLFREITIKNNALLSGTLPSSIVDELSRE